MIARSIWPFLPRVVTEDQVTEDQVTEDQVTEDQVTPGYAVLLEEITEKKPRFCIATLWATHDLAYTIVPDKKAFQKVHDSHKGTYLNPGVDIDSFSWSIGAYTIGRRFREKDFVSQQYSLWTERAKQLMATLIPIGRL